MTRRSLLAQELIRYDWAPSSHHTGFPKATVLTEIGREVVCIILGHYADNLTARTFRKIIESPSIVSRIEQELAIARQWQAERLVFLSAGKTYLTNPAHGGAPQRREP